MRIAEVARLQLRTPPDVLAAVPYLLGFHPGESLVVLGLRGTRLVFSVRCDLPVAGTPPDRDAAHLAAIFRRQRATKVLVVGYGSAERVTPLASAMHDRFVASGLDVVEMLRAADGRYWCYLCEAPECCPPEGTPYDISSSRIAAEATYAGQVALPDRDMLVRRLAAPQGPALAAMEEATERAERRLIARLDGASTAGSDAAGGRVGQRGRGAAGGRLARAEVFAAAGAAAIGRAVQVHAAGGRLTDDEVADLSLLLASVAVRDLAWEPIGPTPGGPPPEPSTVELHIGLWSDVVSRACPDLVAPAASLLSYAAWCAGDGTTAAIALDRALAADPAYSMARLMAEVLHRALPPASAAGRRRRRRGRRR